MACQHTLLWTTSATYMPLLLCLCICGGQRSCLDPDFGTLPKRKAYSFGHPTNTVNAPTTATSPTQLPKACANSNIAITRPDKNCTDALLLALTPAKYSLNNTADTSGSRAFISPAQVRGLGQAFVGKFASVMQTCQLALQVLIVVS